MCACSQMIPYIHIRTYIYIYSCTYVMCCFVSYTYMMFEAQASSGWFGGCAVRKLRVLGFWVLGFWVLGFWVLGFWVWGLGFGAYGRFLP